MSPEECRGQALTAGMEEVGGADMAHHRLSTIPRPARAPKIARYPRELRQIKAYGPIGITTIRYSKAARRGSGSRRRRSRTPS